VCIAGLTETESKDVQALMQVRIKKNIRNELWYFVALHLSILLCNLPVAQI
jgi:hypothetical protein